MALSKIACRDSYGLRWALAIGGSLSTSGGGARMGGKALRSLRLKSDECRDLLVVTSDELAHVPAATELL
jgi:hypothetical protein